MGIDISSITNEKLRQIATMADENGTKNGKLEDNEVSVFENSAKAALVSEKRDGIAAGFDENALGDVLKLANPVVNSQTTSNPVKISGSKKDVKAAESYAKTVLKEEVGSSELKDVLKERFGMEKGGANENNPVYIALLEKIDNIMGQIEQVGYNSKDDVEALKKKVNIDKKDDFSKDVLNILIDDAEAKQRSKEYGEIKNDYDTLVKNNMNEEEAYRQVRKEYKNKGSYYKDYLKHGSFAYKLFHMKRKSSEFEKNTIMSEARVTARNAQRESKAITSGQVKSDAKATMKANKDWNKYTRKALNGENNFGEWISGYDSDMKVARKNVARKNNVENIRENGLTEKQIHKAVDKRSTFGSKATFGLFFKKKTQLFETLKASGLVEQKPNGDYDVSKLSMLIGDNVGANYKLDRQSKDFKALSELTKTTSALAVATELKNLTPKEAKMLVEMCGYDIEGKGIDAGKAILGATVGALVSGLGGAYGAATNKRPVIDSTLTNKNHVEVNIKYDGNLDDVIDQVEGQGGQVNIIEGGIQIIIDQKQAVPLYWKASRHILKTALKSAMVGAAFGMVAGLKDKPETPITSTQFDCTSLEEYGKRLDNEVKTNAISPKYAEALKLIAATFVKDGENGEKVWDCDKYKAFLNKAAGDGGILNREEFITMLERIDKQVPNEPVKPDKTQTTTTQDTTESNTSSNQDVPEAKDDCSLEYKEDIKMTDSNKYTWTNIVNMYYKNCIGTHSISEITTKIKQYNHIPKDLRYIPAGIVLPFDLFGDGECTRTEKQDVKRTKVAQAKTFKKFNGQLGDTGVRARAVCKTKDGYEYSDWTSRHKDRDGAEKEARENGWIK